MTNKHDNSDSKGLNIGRKPGLERRPEVVLRNHPLADPPNGAASRETRKMALEVCVVTPALQTKVRIEEGKQAIVPIDDRSSLKIYPSFFRRKDACQDSMYIFWTPRPHDPNMRFLRPDGRMSKYPDDKTGTYLLVSASTLNYSSGSWSNRDAYTSLLFQEGVARNFITDNAEVNVELVRGLY